MSAATILSSKVHKAIGSYDLVDRYVTTNPFQTRIMIEAGLKEEKIICLPTFASSIFYADHNTRNPAYILYAGRIDPSKGIEIVIDAIAILRKSRSDVPKLRIAGHVQNSSYDAQLKAYVEKLGLDDHIDFIGTVRPEDMPDLYSRAIATIIPSRWYENLPNTFLESIACGTPVIASNQGSLKEAVEEDIDGLLFETGDAISLSKKIVLLLDDRELRIRLGKAAILKSRTLYSEKSHVARLIMLFYEISSINAVIDKHGSFKK